MEEGGGSSEMESTTVEIAAERIEHSAMYNLVMDVLGFVLFMYQQIPSILQDVSLEFDALNTEYKDLEVVLAETEMRAAQRRIHMGRKRQVKHGIRTLEKLMKSVANSQTALQLVFSEIPRVEAVILVLGASPNRPRHVYELCFSHGKDAVSSGCDFTKTRAAEGISRKVFFDQLKTCVVISISFSEIRETSIIRNYIEGMQFSGPSKLFLLVKAPSSLSLPLHFLPKSDFRYNKKIVPMRLRIKCRNQDRETHSLNCGPNNTLDSTSNDYIWFQCRHVIKGLPSKTTPEE